MMASETAPPNDPPTVQEPVATTPAEPIQPAADPLQVPLPEEFTVKELIEKRREEKGPLYACCFTFCCCFLCYESLEFVLDFLCCKTCK